MKLTAAPSSPAAAKTATSSAPRRKSCSRSALRTPLDERSAHRSPKTTPSGFGQSVVVLPISYNGEVVREAVSDSLAA
jgi:hypothetical protein